MTYHELSTKKYWQASTVSEIKQLKKEQNSRSVRAFNMFLVFFLVFLGCSYLLQQEPGWLAPMVTSIEQIGIVEQIRSMFVQ